jgi:eukaryotic-like serine/threonine-protein kinase
MGAEPGGNGSLLAGRYEVGPLVGLGGTAQVYRAVDHALGRTVAIKIFRPGSAPAPGYGGARELQVLAGVSHPGLVGIHDSGVDPQGCPFVVMDFVDGSSLSARLHDGPLPADTVVRTGIILAEALAAVHVRGVVHRDVKPANVLLDADDRPWLTDFGIARIVDATRVTDTGIVVGTAAYMAPEQVRGEPVGPPADVYALGLLLLEAVTGRREYEGGALESALARLHRAPEIPRDVPDPLGPVLRRMTALDPGDRPTALEVAAALRNVPAPARPRRRRAVPVAALASVVAAALAGGLTLTGGGAPAESVASGEVAAAPPVVAAAAPPPVAPPVAAVAVDEPPAPAARQPVPVALARRDGTQPRAAASSRAVRRTSGDGDDRRRHDDADDSAHRDDDAADRDDDDKRDDQSEKKKDDESGKGSGDDRSDDDETGKGSGDDRSDDDKSGKDDKGKGEHQEEKDDDGHDDRSGSSSGKG